MLLCICTSGLQDSLADGSESHHPTETFCVGATKKMLAWDVQLVWDLQKEPHGHKS